MPDIAKKRANPLLGRTSAVTAVVGKREFWYFGGCDYHGLSWNRLVREAAIDAADRWGLGVSASRKTTGNHPIYVELERALAKFFRAPASLVVSTGYLTNICVAQSLAGEIDAVYIDEKAHGSLQDAALHFGTAKVVPIQHRSARHLSKLLREAKPEERPILLTDGLFAANGSLAPLAAYKKALPPSGWLLVDDAHAAGTIGPSGRGSLAHHGLDYKNVIQTMTLSKALGAGGGAINASRKAVDRIMAASRAFVGSTPPGLPQAAAALQGLSILNDLPGLQRILRNNAKAVRKAAAAADWQLADGYGPIIALTPKRPEQRQGLAAAFDRLDIHFPWIVYPGGAESGYLRLAVSSAHPPEAIELLCHAFSGGGKTG